MKGTQAQGQAAGSNNQSTNNQQTAMGAAYTGAQANQQQNFTMPNQQQQQNAGGSLRRQLGRFGAPMSRVPTSEILSQLTEVLKKEYTNTAEMKDLDWELLSLDYNNTGNINASAIVVIVGDKQNPNSGVGFHALILEADSNLNQERTETFAGQTYEAQKVTGDLVDRVMTDFLQEKVRERRPNQPIYYADACVVPRDFDITDKRLVRSLAANAVTAAWTEVEIRLPDYQYLNLAAAKDTTLQVRTTYNQPETTDALGLPVRADVSIDFRSVPTNVQNQMTENVDRVENYARATGFVELTFDPTVDVANPYMSAALPRRPEDTQLYAARFVLTQLDSLDHISNAMQLLALSTTFPLLDASQPWMQSFLPAHLSATAFQNRKISGSFDPRDIGALNYEAGMKAPGETVVDRIKTEDPNFDHAQFFALMKTLVRDGIALSMDVPEAGDSTWYNRIFLAARERNSPAYATLIQAADALTNGNFSQFFNKSSMTIVMDQDDRVHLGYYHDQEGVKRDVRNIDLVYMLNRFGATDSTIGRQWTETFTNLGRPMNVNLAIRRKMIEACVGNVVFTGFARRVTFHRDFIAALDQAISASGVHVRVVTQGADTRAYQRGSSGLSAGGALNTGFHSGAYDRSYGTAGVAGGGYRPAYTPQRF